MTCEVALTCFLCWQEDCPRSPKQNSGLEVGSAPGLGPHATWGGPVAEGAAGLEGKQPCCEEAPAGRETSQLCA